MLKTALGFIIATVSLVGAVAAQPGPGGPGPGPPPSPWLYAAPKIYSAAGSCVTMPQTVTGGCMGSNTINAQGLFVSGLALVSAGAVAPVGGLPLYAAPTATGTGTCLSAGNACTLATACSFVKQIATFLGPAGPINLADGTYSTVDAGTSSLCPVAGNSGGSSSQLISIIGNCAVPTNVILAVPNNNLGIYVTDAGEVSVSCFEITLGSGAIGIENAGQGAVSDYNNIVWGASGANSVHVSGQAGSYVNMGAGGEIITANFSFHWQFSGDGRFNAGGVTAIANSTTYSLFLSVTGSQYINLSSWSFTGTSLTGVRAVLTGPGYLLTAAAAPCASVIPGNTACNLSLGFQDNAGEGMTGTGIGVGQQQPSIFDPIVGADLYSSLPGSPTAGQISHIVDGLAANCSDGACTTPSATVTGGGGSLDLLIGYNGAAWRIFRANAPASTTINSQSCLLGGACTITATAASMTVGGTTILSGTSGRFLYDNAGVLGEATVTGTLGSVVLSSSPTIASLTVTGAFTATGLVTNADLANSTISGVSLGGNLFTLTFGPHLSASGSSYNGSAATTIQSDATSANTASTIVTRDSSGNFAANNLTLSGVLKAIAASSINGNTAAVPAGIGNAPILVLQGQDTAGANGITIYNHSAGGSLDFATSLGTGLSPTLVTNGTPIGYVRGNGYDGTNYDLGAYIVFITTQDFSATHNGSQIKFFTTANNSTTQTLALTIGQDQSLAAAGPVSASNLSLGGATIGGNALAVTGTSLLNGNVSVSAANFGLTGNQSLAAWTTNGARYANVAGTLTDTTSSGTVPAVYDSVFGGNTIAASSATTYTLAVGSYFKAPVAGTNATFTANYALGADSLDIVGGTLAAGASVLNISATQPASPGATQTAIQITITGNGSAAQNNNGMIVTYAAGYTGANTNTAFSAGNSSLGTGGSIAAGGTITGNLGGNYSATGAASGYNVGLSARAANAAVNFGLAGLANSTVNSGTNIGVMGLARNLGTSPVFVGGWFTTGQTAIPTTSAALIADNVATGVPIALFQTGGSTVASVNATGGLTATLTQTSVAQSGTVCYNSSTLLLTYDATLGCLASLEELKDIHGPIEGALAKVEAMKPFWFSPINRPAGSDLAEQPGFGAHQIESVDRRLVGYGENGELRGVRYMEMSAILTAAFHEIVDACRDAANDNFCVELLRRSGRP